MGMFDYITVRCPNCGAEVEFQSKAGNCSLSYIPLNEAPDYIKADVLRDESKCPGCDKVVKIVGAVMVYPVIV